MATEAPIRFGQAATDAGKESPAERFAQICAEHGTRVAVTFMGRHTSYCELESSAACVAEKLRRHGAGPGTLVAICLERGVEMIAAMLGTAMTGAAYLPLDPAYPAARLAETLEDARPIAVIEAGGIRPRQDALPLDESTAYVIYTSGSTGKPKGVAVSRSNLMRLLDHTTPCFRFGPDDVWTMFHSFAFDFSVWELWGALLTGGRVVVVPYAVSRAPVEFRELLVRERVTVLNQTPSAFALLSWVDARVDTAPANDLSLRVVIFGGEALNLASLRDWIERHGDRQPQFVNMYGITETTVHVTWRLIHQADTSEHESLIGEPIPGLELRLLDESLKPVPDGEEGEICVGGDGVALGYLRRPELTAERFVRDIATGQRLYRSGDIGRRRPDGELVYLGRRDGQVKIAGFRIELGEVEAQLLACAGVDQACAVAWNGRLVAFVRGDTLTESSLHGLLGAELAARVPAHMRPALYKLVEALPLTVNGKVDRAALVRQMDLLGSGTRAAAPSRPPTGDLIELVRDAWRSALGPAPVGLDDNFFDVGGTSLLLVRVRARLAEALGRDIPTMWMFEATTIRALANRLVPADNAGSNAAAQNARKAKLAFERARIARGKR